MKSTAILITFLCNALVSIGQDVHFSQYHATPLLVNPAYAGLLHDMQGVVNYRNQYKSVATPFTTSAASFDMKTSTDNTRNATIGLGIQFLYDKSGDAQLKQTAANLDLSCILKTGIDSRLSIGLMGGFGQRSFDYSALRWESQYSGGVYDNSLSSMENFATTNFSYFDAGAGIVYSFGRDQSYIKSNDGVKGSFGISAFHFGLPANSFSGTDEKLKSRYMAHGRVELGKQNFNLTYIPALYLALQGKQTEILFGSSFRYLLQEGSHYTGFRSEASITVGAHYRWMDALVGSVQVDYANYAFGISYDFNVSQLSGFSNGRGGFELFLRFVTPNPFGRGGSASFR